jgi:hypothetical protein
MNLFEASGLIFHPPIPFEKIEKIPHCLIVTSNISDPYSDQLFINHIDSSSVIYNFPIKLTTDTSTSFYGDTENNYFDLLFLLDEGDHFEREAMFQMVFSLLKENKEYKFEIIECSWIDKKDYKTYDFSDLENSEYVKSRPFTFQLFNSDNSK